MLLLKQTKRQDVAEFVAGIAGGILLLYLFWLVFSYQSGMLSLRELVLYLGIPELSLVPYGYFTIAGITARIRCWKKSDSTMRKSVSLTAYQGGKEQTAWAWGFGLAGLLCVVMFVGHMIIH